MYRTAELGRKIPKKEFEEHELILRQELLEVQQELLAAADFTKGFLIERNTDCILMK